MILQALTRLYAQLVENEVLDRPGWQPARISYGLMLNSEGELVQVAPLLVPQQRGKKEVYAPRVENVPARARHAKGIAANFLCDNASYMLGADAKGNPERTAKCFEACKALHRSLLGDSSAPAAQAIVRFFETWRPELAGSSPVLAEFWNALLAGCNLTFMFDGQPAVRIAELREIWNRRYAQGGGGKVMRCLVTGERGPIAILHPSIKGVAGAQPMGVLLVSFNASAYESFGRNGEQGANAPVSESAAFAYGAALNCLLSRRENRMRLGDTSAVFWAEGAKEGYADLFLAGMYGMDSDGSVGEDDLKAALLALADGRDAWWKEFPLSPSNRFYILGLAPNAARLSVRFFLQDAFGNFARNLARHYQRLEIVRPASIRRKTLSIRDQMGETVNVDKEPLPRLPGEVLRAILSDLPYPATLFHQVQLRIRAEHKITYGRAAILKAYLLKNHGGQGAYKEVLQVQLNENTQYPAYLLGRLFSVLEALQEAANPGINTTISDRYFNSACAAPATVFPQLIRLSRAHLRKLSAGNGIYFNKQITAILGSLNNEFPMRLNLPDQGIFQIGYYHQTQKRYEKKEDKNNV